MDRNKDRKSPVSMGRVHSIESFGSVDGPGVRFVVFLSGCNMRCQYCHNPDTWDGTRGERYTARELVGRAVRYRSYWGEEGGMTVSGGEPLLQLDFLAELAQEAQKEGIHMAVDTSGNPFTRQEPFFSKFQELLKYVDLFLLDIKHIDPQQHRLLTGQDNRNILDMAAFLQEMGKPVWIRHVLVPGKTDRQEDLMALGAFLKGLHNIERVEVLPYHTMGSYKWEALGMDYPLKGVEPPDGDKVKWARQLLGGPV